MRDAEAGQITGYRGGVSEDEGRAELYPISRRRGQTASPRVFCHWAVTFLRLPATLTTVIPKCWLRWKTPQIPAR